MEHGNDPPLTPKDAGEATEEQQEVQEELDHQNDDPEAPGRHETEDQIAGET
jgi:hypothetical protein